MNNARPHRQTGFTLVEVMIVVAIIAMLAAIGTNSVYRARKRSQATKILDDLRLLDGALDLWALEKNKSTGDVAQFSDIRPYLKEMNKLSVTGKDLFEQDYGPFTVDITPKVAPLTFNTLSDVAPASFWSPFK